MEILKFIEVIAEQFEDIDTDVFTAKTDFRDNEEWDSLTALSIIAVLDSEYNVKIDAEALENATTIEELYSLVQDNS